MRPHRDTFHVKHLVALMEASHKAGKTIRHLDAQWLDLKQLHDKLELPPMPKLQQFLGGLSSLTVRLGDWGCPLEAWDKAAELISSAENVKTLVVEGSSKKSHLPGRQDRMDGLLKKTITKMTSMTLAGLWLDEVGFKDFISKQPCLASLTLSKVTFTTGPQQILMEYAESLSIWGPLEIPHYASASVTGSDLDSAWARVSVFLKQSKIRHIAM